MPVILTSDPVAFESFARRVAIDAELAGKSNLDGLAGMLEQAFNDAYMSWRDTALFLQAQPSASLAHMPTMSTYASDFGVMLAWLRVVADLAGKPETTGICCRDPWLFRALSLLPSVQAGKAPGLTAKRCRFFCRGVLARSVAAVRCIAARWRTRAHRRDNQLHAGWLLVYGHPESNARGNDAYFGNLMDEMVSLQRLMHTDCGAAFALQLATDKRTRSLHAWGRYATALTMPFARWRPDVTGLDAKVAWLVRRAAAVEGSGGSAAMTRWQIACHTAWLHDIQPRAVSWPWENHPWERDFVRRARASGARTLGYQHTVVGRHMYNQGAEANLDGLQSIPDEILLNGPAFRADLRARGIPDERMSVVGAYRVGAGALPRYAADGAVFLALSNNPAFAAQMVRAARPLASAELPFVVKDHPLSPYPVSESANFSYTRAPLAELPPLRALIYCTGTTGLQGLLAGIPTIRFVPDGGIALDILPHGMQVASVPAAELAKTLQDLPAPMAHDPAEMFPPPDLAKWRVYLETHAVPTEDSQT